MANTKPEVSSPRTSVQPGFLLTFVPTLSSNSRLDKVTLGCFSYLAEQKSFGNQMQPFRKRATGDGKGLQKPQRIEREVERLAGSQEGQSQEGLSSTTGLIHNLTLTLTCPVKTLPSQKMAGRATTDAPKAHNWELDTLPPSCYSHPYAGSQERRNPNRTKAA